MLEATNLPTEPQPLPNYKSFFIYLIEMNSLTIASYWPYLFLLYDVFLSLFFVIKNHGQSLCIEPGEALILSALEEIPKTALLPKEPCILLGST